MSTKHVKFLIIGAGISGLCAALSLGQEALILEKEAAPGGYCRSIRQDGYLWDYAGHFFHFNTDAARQFFQSLFAPEELVEKEKRCRILYGGALIDYPFQNNIHELEKDELIDCLYDLFHRPVKQSYTSFSELLFGSYGRSITEKFLRPYNEKLYACDLNTLAPTAMGRFFPSVDPAAIIDGMKDRRDKTYNSRFFYPKNGAGAFIDRLCQQLSPGSLLTGRSLAALKADEKTAIDSWGDAYRYEVLINTSPLKYFLSLLGEADKAQADALFCNKVLVFNLGFEKKAPFHDLHWLYVPGSEADYYRVGFYDNILCGNRASLYVEIGYPEESRIDTDEELARTLYALQAQGLIQTENRLLSHRALIMDPAYVHIRPETESMIQTVKAELARQGIYTIGRYGSWRYCSMEDCMLEAFSLAESLKGGEA